MRSIKDFAKLHKRITVLVTIGAAAAVGIVIAAFVFWKGNSSGKETSYREYTVSKGDVMIGTTESGTVSLADETIFLPVDCEISSILVPSGTSVKKGDPILQIDLDSVADGSADTKEKLESARLSLQSAMNDQAQKLETAKITYEANKYLATSAPVTLELAQAQIAHSIASAQSTLENDQTSLEQYKALQKSWAADDEKLQNLKKWMEDAENCKTSYETQLSSFEEENSSVISMYTSLKSAVETDEQKYLAAKKGDTTIDGYDEDTWNDMLDEARDSYKAYYNSIANTVIQQKKELEDQIAQYTAEYNNYSSAYNDFKEIFSDKYNAGSAEMSKTELDNKVASLESTVKEDQYNLEKTEKSADISAKSAQQTAQTDLNTAQYAQNNYDLMVNQLNVAVTSAQSSYDKLQRQMDEINSALSNDGVITSPCDGVVASVSYTDGDSVEAENPMMVISGNDALSVSVSVSEDDIINISVGQKATISLSAYEDRMLDAVVDSITAQPARSGSSSVTYSVVVKSTGTAAEMGTVYDGMSADATIVQHAADDVLYVNNRTISFQDGISSVLVKSSDGTTAVKTVKTGFSDGTYVEITSGLTKGETVLAESTVSAK
ncbi:MAG: HlyD family efflux transporter periplasmic adaptor subunit [Oscillospiraceae bacterium]|nr:HlyD family efflux transporter periplasmic adaptor subunit [Oscillospiraceae bacterium]